MDERKKLIRELEDKYRLDLASSEEAFGALGRSLLEGLEKNGNPRAEETGNPINSALEEYRRLRAEIGENQERISEAEADIARYQEITEEISQKEKGKAKDSKTLSSLYAQTGRGLLSDPAFTDFASEYQNETEELLSGIDAREARLEELERKNGNLISWVGKNAEALMVKTMLLKNQADLHRIYRTAGEKFIASGEDFEAGEDELHDSVSRASELKLALEELTGEIASLRQEKKNTAARFRGEGNPVRRIQEFEKKISLAREELAALYRRFGKLTTEKEWKDSFIPLFGDDDRAALDRAASFAAAARESETKIEKLKTEIAIDTEKAGIEKLKASIEAEGRKIKAANDGIAEMEKSIEAAEERIAELTKLLR